MIKIITSCSTGKENITLYFTKSMRKMTEILILWNWNFAAFLKMFFMFYEDWDIKLQILYTSNKYSQY